MSVSFLSLLCDSAGVPRLLCRQVSLLPGVHDCGMIFKEEYIDLNEESEIGADNVKE